MPITATTAGPIQNNTFNNNSNNINQQHDSIQQRQVLVRLDTTKQDGATDCVLTSSTSPQSANVDPNQNANPSDTTKTTNKHIQNNSTTFKLTRQNSASLNQPENPLLTTNNNRQIVATRKEVAYDLGTKRNSDGKFHKYDKYH